VTAIRVSSGDELLRLQTTLEKFPDAAARARARALRQLTPWLEREVLRAASAASGIAPTVWRALARFSSSGGADRIGVWLGTSDIAAHHLGDVSWSRRAPGATAGGRVFPGSWSWSQARRADGRVMRRRADGRLPIEMVFWEIHAAVVSAAKSLAPAISERYQSIMLRELERALDEASR
jgi:hypothetical protein